ncbi:hypothetical protein TSL6_02180 [Sulfurovum sp. TSL6]|uniref:AAA family ATPase n=1 Tax=Sulfurovum sp. TSL6 TaxID=2826995 RepID=UPI001CC61AFD|nr:ATP-binding protein [Sulfurovum sp. TSL6]GIT99711.1 hypothetical protein TSL6_02180 [Sulfurovum sp. TSL6]
MRINKLLLQDFKFFLGKNELEFGGENVLIYGENGSGKSSIYWALYTFLQSSIKEDHEIKKYFDAGDPQNLINRYAESPDPKIELELIDNEKRKTVYTISNDLINTNRGDDTQIKEANLASDFINYRLLSRIYDFRNSEDIDLFKVFEQEILDYISLSTILNAGEEWQELKIGLDPHPRMTDQTYRDFQDKMSLFNRELKAYLLDIIEDANNFLQNDFSVPIKLTWSYDNATYNDFVRGSTRRRNQKTLPPIIHLKARFLDENIRDKDIPKPHTFLNEAKLTAIALSIRLSILKKRLVGNILKILVLDDLLLSLDMNNRDIVIDIMLDQFDDYQLIILTHDRIFFELVQHKIKVSDRRKWKNIEMYEGVTEDVIYPFIVDSSTYLKKAEKYFYLNEYEISGNFLRKEAESFCKDFLPKRYHYTLEYDTYNLANLIQQCVKYAKDANLDDTLFKKLDSYRQFVLNSTSHDSYDVPKFKSEIIGCLDTLKELRKIKNETFLKKGEILEFEIVDENGSDVYKFEIKLEDDFRLLKIGDDDTVISKGMINYWIEKNGAYIGSTSGRKKDSTHHANITLKKLYEDTYKSSNKVMNPDFWEEIIIRETGKKLKEYKINNPDPIVQV